MPPHYFNDIKKESSQRWDLLERDLKIAAPWHQLFKQVQSPRHVMSELLQNADDANATSAAISIVDGDFIFEHDGDDFNEEHFSSLCQFGYSNKRVLHTIGFRGMGFKSTFSLGDSVELHTPSLKVSFNRNRFTEPIWLDGIQSHSACTRVRVAIKDDHRSTEVKKNLDEWLSSPISLLFFRHIRNIKINRHEIRWEKTESGPVSSSNWMAIHGSNVEKYLIARSNPKEFPSDAIDEIREERSLGLDEEIDFPPCRVEIVLGASGRLHVVLPTQVETGLPFACNAPFIQDPARIKIKDPETSPTNRWLLEQIGKHAASVALQWLQNDDLDITERARAYELFPDRHGENGPLERLCSDIVENAFFDYLQNKPFLLTASCRLVKKNECTILPSVIQETWTEKDVISYFDKQRRPAFSYEVSPGNCENLNSWELIDQVTRSDIHKLLLNEHLPCPTEWHHLLNLWAYVKPETEAYYNRQTNRNLKILPVNGSKILYSADEVVRLGEKRLLQSEEDWSFLSNYLIFFDQRWPIFLAEQNRRSEEQGNEALAEKIQCAYDVLYRIEFENTADANLIIQQVSEKFFSQESISIQQTVKLTQIAAKLGVNVEDKFKYFTVNNELQQKHRSVYYDPDGSLQSILPNDAISEQLLHPAYTQNYESCTKDEWDKWIQSGKTKIIQFVSIEHKEKPIYGRVEIQNEVKRRGNDREIINYPYVTNQFVIKDSDFKEEYWQHWQRISHNNHSFWGKLFRLITQKFEIGTLVKEHVAKVYQISSQRSRAQIIQHPVLPSWILRFRNLPCLPDTKGFYRKPEELLRRTAETEAYIDVEPFIDHQLDNETFRPLLDMLGVRSEPPSPEHLIERLDALSKTSSPPIDEVEKWYRRLDQMIDTCSTDDFAYIKSSFRNQALIFTNNNQWANSLGVFLLSDDEAAPGVDLIRFSVAHLTLWRKIGVADRFSPELAIQWLNDLPKNEVLAKDNLTRARKFLSNLPIRVWEECEYWLSLDGEWTSIDSLKYSISMQSLVAWKDLHPWVKKQTADFRDITADLVNSPPFCSLSPLAEVIESQVHNLEVNPGRQFSRDWLQMVGECLKRAVFDNKEITERIRELAIQLEQTKFQNEANLEMIPYIDGQPAGLSRKTDVVWIDQVCLLRPLPNGKLAKAIPAELSKRFNLPEIKDALNYCYERDDAHIDDYFKENFKLEDIPLEDEPKKRIVIRKQDDETEQTVESDDPPLDEVGVDEDVADVQSDEVLELDDNVEEQQREVRQRQFKPSIMERFARSYGFEKEDKHCFVHTNGEMIVNQREGVFPWERINAAGIVQHRYWAKDHCIEDKPLELGADVWKVINDFPNQYSLILADGNCEAVEMSGICLQQLKNSDQLKIYPATYRIVIQSSMETNYE